MKRSESFFFFFKQKSAYEMATWLEFRRVLFRSAAAGLGARWVPKELRTSFVSMMSYQGMPVEEIARLAGHACSRTTEVVCRRELRPVITTGAEVMDQIFQPK